jgi:diguanylate cyclase (GGDEF)-like protein
MHSLYDALLTQHGRQLRPVRCAYSTITQLHRYFEDVVLENNLTALVIEGLPFSVRRSAREKARARELARAGRHAFYFVRRGDAFNELIGSGSDRANCPLILPHANDQRANEHFLVIADARFSALLVTIHEGTDDAAGGDEVIWTFEPDVVYSALEYLMARVGAEHPYQADAFGSIVSKSVPKATSLQLTLSVTTKLAHLLQEQAGREIAVNRIATAIRESLELGVILQKTVDEVGAALKASSCAMRVEGQTPEQALTYFHFAEEPEGDEDKHKEIGALLDHNCAQLTHHFEPITRDASDETDSSTEESPIVVVPLVFHERFIGALQVTSANPARIWHENEILLLHTVADQVAVAVNHAALFAQIQQQALTDGLTGCYNRRSFEMHLDREVQMARRQHQPLSLVMLDLDRFKQLNDTVGHDAGDSALRKLANCFRQELRGVDSAARFGGDEFALILPQAYPEGALLVAERLRARIEQIKIPGFGNLTASLGIATFPADAPGRSELISAADSALYTAKRAGRNRVCVFDSSANASRLLRSAGDTTAETVEQTM